MGFNSLPREVLFDIVSCQSPSAANLRNYSLVCRSLWDVASAILYGHIDLTIDARYDEQANKKTRRRQLELLTSIASYTCTQAVVKKNSLLLIIGPGTRNLAPVSEHSKITTRGPVLAILSIKMRRCVLKVRC
jgi:hypothetical protein